MGDDKMIIWIFGRDEQAGIAKEMTMTMRGLVLFYAGMIQKKNISSTMLHSFGVASVTWVLCYSWAFGDGGVVNGFVGGLDRVSLFGMGVCCWW